MMIDYLMLTSNFINLKEGAEADYLRRTDMMYLGRIFHEGLPEILKLSQVKRGGTGQLLRRVWSIGVSKIGGNKKLIY